jgi:hypothetical protein
VTNYQHHEKQSSCVSATQIADPFLNAPDYFGGMFSHVSYPYLPFSGFFTVVLQMCFHLFVMDHPVFPVPRIVDSLLFEIRSHFGRRMVMLNNDPEIAFECHKMTQFVLSWMVNHSERYGQFVLGRQGCPWLWLDNLFSEAGLEHVPYFHGMYEMDGESTLFKSLCVCADKGIQMQCQPLVQAGSRSPSQHGKEVRFVCYPNVLILDILNVNNRIPETMCDLPPTIRLGEKIYHLIGKVCSQSATGVFLKLHFRSTSHDYCFDDVSGEVHVACVEDRVTSMDSKFTTLLFYRMEISSSQKMSQFLSGILLPTSFLEPFSYLMRVLLGALA